MTEITRNVYHVLVLWQSFFSVQEITLYFFSIEQATSHAYMT